jgi:RNA polymerase sigma factor (TIGR02999 family)
LPESSAAELIIKWRGGDPSALQELLPLVYQELHRIARRRLRSERENHTLQTTALIHEAYLRLSGVDGADVQDRCHFVALAARLMRQVLVDHARNHLAVKRQGGIRVDFSEAMDTANPPEVDLLGVNDALTRLAKLDEQQAQIVELRFFGGMSIPETSAALNLSTATVRREWDSARAWLRRELQSSSET